MLNFRQVEAFRAVMLTGSMTQAAVELNTTQPNISRVIAQLEFRIGIRLFERMSGKLMPTKEGALFFQDVERAFAGLKGLEESAAALGRRGAGHLRISAIPSLALKVVPQAMKAFAQIYPDVTISLHVEDSAGVCQAVATGGADFGVATEVVSSPGVGHRLIHTAKGVCIVPVGHRLASEDHAIGPGDLAEESFLSLAPQDAGRKLIDQVFLSQGDKRRMLYETHFTAALFEMVASGMGVAIVNSLAMTTFGHLAIKSRPFSPEVVFPTYAIYPLNTSGGMLATAFREVMARTMERLYAEVTTQHLHISAHP